MRSNYFGKAGVCATLLSVFCASCQAAPQIPFTAAQPGQGLSAKSQTTGVETVLFAFGGSNGAYPASGVTQLSEGDGAFYGTTATGGSANAGTVYRMTRRGSERVLLNFKTGKHGVSPSGALTAFDGNFYGTATGTGRCGSPRSTCAGIVFAMDKSGKERTVYAFKGGHDGAQPVGALTALNGALYGTTTYGGKYGIGTIFEVTPSGSEKVLHSFVKPFGVRPTGSLIAFNGLLYGTTTDGGAHSDGTVFSVTTSGKETVLYSFSGSPDGAFPTAGLTELDGTLYGTTAGGGNNYCGNGDPCGTVFSIDTSGNETVIHRFGGSDGGNPQAALTSVNGVLYGTTASGGANACAVERSCGLVFAMDTGGNESIIHDFSGAPDGAFPQASLTYSQGALFGTTANGGLQTCNYYLGCGTVFSITLSTPDNTR